MKYRDNPTKTAPPLQDFQAHKREFSVFNAGDPQYPVLLSVPHAGRDYPDEIIRNLKVPAENLLRLEDRYADRLVKRAMSTGHSAVVANQPRAWLDLNRSPKEIDPKVVDGWERWQLPSPSRKTRGGLGLVPARLTDVGDLWRRKWERADIAQRINRYHEPYHLQISNILQRMKRRFGSAILLDIHSMPPLTDDFGQENANIVVGDLYGRSANGRISELVISFAEYAGFRAKLNHPYAGGYILQRHGLPETGIHGIQLEIDRSLYLDADMREPSPEAGRLSAFIGRLAAELSTHITGDYDLIAAE